MRSILSKFPDGRVGAGLLLLRLSAAISILATPVLIEATARSWIVTLLAVGLLIGLWTRMAAVLCLALLIVVLLRSPTPTGVAAQVLEMAAIMLSGAGAYSTDAIMFGRRTIVLGSGQD
jgi:hypothetical protein